MEFFNLSKPELHPVLKKVYTIMKLTMLALIVFSLNISATVYSQNTKLSVEVNNQSIKEVLYLIERQSEFRFIYESGKIDLDKKVSVHEKEQTVESILNRLFAKEGINYEITENNLILINPAEKKNYPGSQKIQQEKKFITGIVTDANGEPIIGANVVEKGTTNGTITDIDGNYSLTNVAGKTLLISYIGYVSQEVTIRDGSPIHVKLFEDTQKLEEVVVVGYGTQKKVNLTGAVATIDNEVLQNRPVSSVAQSLQGEIPGLSITTGGKPGSASSIRLRGQGSLSNDGKTPPYILIDGVPSDEATMLGLNPDDIDNISVLKDAAASAIYGARAAFGVILITTKSGSGVKGKLQVNYSNNLDFAAFTVIPDMVNSIQFAQAYNDGYRNAGKNPMFTEEWFVKAQNKIDNPDAPATEPIPGNPTQWKFAFDSFDNVNWYNVYYKPGFSSFQQKHTLSLSGTTERINYYVSAGFRDSDSNMRYGEWTNKQYSGLARLNAKMTKWLDLNLNIRYANGTTVEPSSNFNGTGTRLIYHNIWRGWPMTYLKDPNGNWNSNISNVPYLIDGGTVDKNTQQIVLTPSFVIKPFEGLRINFDFTTDMIFETTKTDKQNVPAYLVDGSINQAVWNTRQMQTFAYKDFEQTNYMTYNLFATYEKQFADHYMSIMGGIQQENTSLMMSSAKRFNLLFPTLPVLGLADGDRVVGDKETEWATFGSFVRINYNYKEKYLIELNGRYDGSAKFRSDHRWGFFPSFSMAYNISREDYWESLSEYINACKIRFSYGQLGNQNVSSFTFLPQMAYNSTDFIFNNARPIYVNSPGLINPDLTWEKSRTFNFGLDLGLLSNRLNLTAEVYNRKTYDMFGPSEKLPAVIGASIPQANNAALSTTGFELSIGWRGQIDDLNYSITGMLSDYTTTIDSYYNPTGVLTSWSEGRKLGEIWGYETDRYFTEEDFVVENGNYLLKEGIPNQHYFYNKWSPGDIKYKDIDGDKKIDQGSNTLEDHGDKVLLGNSTPRFQYGMNLSAQYKGIDFRLFLQGVAKRDVWYNDVTFWGFGGRAQSNFTQSHLDYWTPENQNAYYPKPYLEGDRDSKNKQVQSKYLLNAAYLRVKNIQLGYTLPKNWLSKMSMDNVRLYVSGENLFTFTQFPEFYDPEVYGKSHPMQKHLSFGVNVSF